MKIMSPAEYVAAGGASGYEALDTEKATSLHIKTPNGPKRTTPFGQQRPKMTTQQLLEQQQQQQQLLRYGPIVTRSQRGGGLPSRRPDYRPSLDDLTEEQLQMAIARDPELAAALKAAAEEYGDKVKKRSPYYRSKEGKFNEPPEHLRAMMEEGIPVKQWIILFLLLGAGLFQLRKVLLGPKTDKSGKKTALPRKSPQKGQRNAGKQQKGKKVSSSEKGMTPRSAVPPPPPPPEKKPAKQKEKKVGIADKIEASSAVPTLAAEANAETALPEKVLVTPHNGTEISAAEPKAAKAAKKKKKTAKKVQPKKENKPENVSSGGEEQPQSPDIGSVDHVSAAEVVADSEDIAKSAAEKSEGDGWQTVRKGSVADKGEGRNGSKVPAMEQDAENDAPTLSEEPSPAASAAAAPNESTKSPLSTSSEPASKHNGASNNATFEKATQAEATKFVTPFTLPVVSMDDDAALALRLQEEEEKLAKTFSSPVVDDSWAEVTPRRSKRRSGVEQEAGAASTVTEEW